MNDQEVLAISISYTANKLVLTLAGHIRPSKHDKVKNHPTPIKIYRYNVKDLQL